MEYGELYLPPVALTTPGHNARTGCFMKGHVPFNKGKKWSEYLGKRKQKRCAKGWANLDKYRHVAKGGNNKKAVIAVYDDGTWAYFASVGDAGEKLNIMSENVGRCCRWNMRGKSVKYGKPNTDYRYMGIRFYFEKDDKWMKKIIANY